MLNWDFSIAPSFSPDPMPQHHRPQWFKTPWIMNIGLKYSTVPRAGEQLSEWTSEWCERTSEKTREWLTTSRFQDSRVLNHGAQWVEWLWNWCVGYWAIRSSARSFARTADSFAWIALLASLARSTALICSLTHSLAPELMETKNMSMNWTCRFDTVSTDSAV